MPFPPDKLWFSRYRQTDRETHVSWRVVFRCNARQKDYIVSYLNKVNIYNVLDFNKRVNIDCNVSNLRVEKSVGFIWRVHCILMFKRPVTGFWVRGVIRSTLWNSPERRQGVYDIEVYSTTPRRYIYSQYRNPFRQWRRPSPAQQAAFARAVANPQNLAPRGMVGRINPALGLPFAILRGDAFTTDQE